MANYKKQHWIPQYYLRFFSKDNKNIYCYNHRKNLFLKVPIITQAANDHFYGSADIEQSMNMAETKHKETITKLILLKGRNFTEEDHLVLLSFVSLLHARTNKAKDSTKEMTAKFVETKIKPAMKADKQLMSKITEDQIASLEITHKADHPYRMLFALTSPPLLHDLEPVVVLNHTPIPFIIGDFPVIYHNNFLNKKGLFGYNGSFISGLQIFCPLNPEITLILADSNVYYIKGNIIRLTDSNVITELNLLQVLSSQKVVYTSDKGSKALSRYFI